LSLQSDLTSDSSDQSSPHNKKLGLASSVGKALTRFEKVRY